MKDATIIVEHLFWVKVWVGGFVIAFVTWLLIHGLRISKAEKKTRDNTIRIIKLENYPSHEDRLKTLEGQCDGTYIPVGTRLSPGGDFRCSRAALKFQGQRALARDIR